MVKEQKILLHELDEDEWRLLQGFIPRASSPKELESGVVRTSVNAILRRMRTGKPCQSVPQMYSDYTSICRRFKLWRENGVLRDVTMTLANVRKGKCISNSPRIATTDTSVRRPPELIQALTR